MCDTMRGAPVEGDTKNFLRLIVRMQKLSEVAQEVKSGGLQPRDSLLMLVGVVLMTLMKMGETYVYMAIRRPTSQHQSLRLLICLMLDMLKLLHPLSLLDFQLTSL